MKTSNGEPPSETDIVARNTADVELRQLPRVGQQKGPTGHQEVRVMKGLSVVALRA